MTKQIQYVALGCDPDHYALLPPEAVDLWQEIEKHRSTHWKDVARRDDLMRIGGCLDKLAGALLQISRLRAHHDHLLETARLLADQGVPFAIRGLPALVDFEGLLLQGRSALDRLTWFLTGSYPSKTSSFRKLKNILSEFTGKRHDARELVAIVEVVEPWFNVLLAKLDAPESLRDLVGHKHAIAEGIETCFAVTYTAPRQVLAFDCEVRLPRIAANTPLLQSARDAAQYLSFTVLNSLAVSIGIRTLPATAFNPTWLLRTVVLSDFLIHEPDGSPLTENALLVVRRMTPDGFDTSTRNYRPAIREHVVKV